MYQEKEVIALQMDRILIQLPRPLKAKLMALKAQGYTASGYIRALLERELTTDQTQKRRMTP